MSHRCPICGEVEQITAISGERGIHYCDKAGEWVARIKGVWQLEIKEVTNGRTNPAEGQHPPRGEAS